MVGPSRGLEELSRPMAVGRIRGIFGQALRAVSAESKGIFNAISERQGTPEHGRYQEPSNRFTGTHLDGATHSVVRDWSRLLPGFDLLEGWLRAANVARAIGGSAQPGLRSFIQGYDEGLLQNLRQQTGLDGRFQVYCGKTYDPQHGLGWQSQNGLVLQPVRLRHRHSALHLPRQPGHNRQREVAHERRD